MSLSKVKYKKAWSDRAVSEVIGTILMLAITVVLFSSIMVFVMNMPVPNNTPISDFKASLSVSTNKSGGFDHANLTLLHNGGQPLIDYATYILVKNGSSSIQHLYIQSSNSKGTIVKAASVTETIWQIGQTWSFDLNSGLKRSTLISASTQIEVDVVDIESNSMIWSSKVGAGTGDNAPVIMQRWTDSDRNTLTPDPIIEGDVGFSLFVRATDSDSTLVLGSVTIDAASFAGAYSSTLTSGLWEFRFTNSITQASLYDGKPILITADDGTHQTHETFILKASASERGPQGATGPQGPASGSGGATPSGLPDYLKYFDSDQGYVILGPNTSVDPPQLPNFTDARNLFKQGEWVFVRVASFKLQNIFAQNSLLLVNRLSGVSIAPCGSTNTTPFYRVSEASSVNVYEAKFDSIQLLGGYDMKIDLQSTVTQGSSLISFGAITGLIVQPVSGSQLTLPEIRVNRTMPLNTSTAEYMGSYDNPFDISDASKCKIYVDLILLNCGGGNTLTIGNAELMDLRNRQILYGAPPEPSGTNGTFGKKYSDLGGLTGKSYSFAIDLRLKNGYNYVPGLASYTLVISNVFDSNEGVYSLSINVWINSATQTKNFVMATSGFGFSSASPNFIHYDFLYQTENNRFFTTRVIDGLDMGPGSKGDFDFYRAIYFDIDGDGDRDIIASEKYSNVYTMGIYINRLNEFGVWEPRSVLSSSSNTKVTALAYGDVDSDSDYDWVAATTNQIITLYYNSFPVTSNTLITLAAGQYVYEMRLTDLTGDGKADLVALVGGDNPRTINSVGKIYMWDLSTAIPTPIAAVDASANIYDFDVADIDGDSDPDYAVVSSAVAGNVKWWESRKTTTDYFAQGETNVTGTSSPSTNPTRSSPPDGAPETITEVSGSLEHKWNTYSISGSSPILTVTAKVPSGTTDGFQFFYSTSSSGPWTFMFAVTSSQTSYADFTFPFPFGASGVIHLRVVDTNPSDSTNDEILIDMIRISTSGQVTFNTLPAQEHQLYTDATQRVIGIGDFDNYGNLDVAVANTAGFKVINSTSTPAIPNLLATFTSAIIYPTGDTFSVADVNGDGLDDIVSTLTYTYSVAGPPPKTYIYPGSILYEWLNVGLDPISHKVDFLGITIKNMCVTYGEDTPGSINCIVVENPYG